MPRAKYALRDGDTGRRLARWQDTDGFFVGTTTAEQWWDQTGDEPPEQLEIKLDGLSPEPDLHLLSFRDEEDDTFALGDILVDILDTNEAILGTYDLWGATLETSGDGRGSGTLWANVSTPPHASARTIWDHWRDHLPNTDGQWTALPPGERDGWVEAAQLHYFHKAGERRTWPMPTNPATLHGEQIADLASFFCAIGEAFGGPGGYFGSNLTALADCLANLDREPGEQLQLRWTAMAVAEEGLARRVETGEGWMRILDIATGVLERYNVEVLRG